jgi:hypothetical protein
MSRQIRHFAGKEQFFDVLRKDLYHYQATGSSGDLASTFFNTDKSTAGISACNLSKDGGIASGQMFEILGIGVKFPYEPLACLGNIEQFRQGQTTIVRNDEVIASFRTSDIGQFSGNALSINRDADGTDVGNMRFLLTGGPAVLDPPEYIRFGDSFTVEVEHAALAAQIRVEYTLRGNILVPVKG